MSFVSIVGNKNYINVVCDGLAVYEDGTREENFQKFEKLDRNFFIAYAGTLHTCMFCINKMKELLIDENLSYDEIYVEILNYTKSLVYSDKSKAMICIGGKDENVLRFSTFSNNVEHQTNDFKLNNKDINYCFLNNYREDVSLDDLFEKYVMRYKSLSQNQIFLAQRDLNEYVADVNPNEVNKNIKRFTLKK